MRRIRTSSRLLAILLVLIMVFGSLPLQGLAANDDITVYISFEGYNLGHGFYIEPTIVRVPADSSAMDATSALLNKMGYEYSLTWGLDRIQNIHPGDPVNPPPYINIILEAGRDDGSLGSFDYSPAGGWLNTVNHLMLDVGADDFIVSDSDVIRWQFSVEGWGADLGLDIDRGFWTDPLYDHADKTQLIRALFVDGVDSMARQAALDVIIDPLATPEQVAAALEALTSGQNLPGSKDELNAVITQAEALQQQEYTFVSWSVLQNALNIARIVAGSATATQVEVDQAKGALQVAIDNLVNISLLPDWAEAMDSSLRWIRNNITHPTVSIAGGEWAILALARANIKDEEWDNIYLKNLDAALEAGDNGNLVSWTDFQRVTLALTSLGLDASDYNGHDLTEAFSTFIPTADRPNHSRNINADIFALIALDSKFYDGDREQFVNAILGVQYINGGWGLVSNMPSVEITAMAMQALAPYYDNNAAVKSAVDSGFAWLDIQDIADVEGNAQVIVALTALGIDPVEYVDALLEFYDPVTGGFRRTGMVNTIATEQAAYALVAYWRFVNDMNSLYNMSDAGDRQAVDIPVNKDELIREIERAEGLIRSEYTSSTWATMEIALIAAREIRDNQYAVQVQVNEARNSLVAAINALVRIGTGGQPQQARASISVTDPGARAGQTNVFFTRQDFDLRPGETAYSLLRRTGLNVRSRGHMEFGGMYVVSINGWGEFSDGPHSGWVHSVNNRFPNYSSSLRVLQDGDEVEWVFTRNLGQDVGGGGVSGGNQTPDINLGTETGAENDSVETGEDSSVLITEWVNPFADVTNYGWYYYAVRFVYVQDLMNGTAADRFSPNINLSRAMAVTMLWRLEGEPIVAGSSAFDDVQSERWYSEAIAWAEMRGIVRGYGNGLFGTNDYVTREQLATIFHNYTEYKELDTTNGSFTAEFTDKSAISEWAVDAMEWANGNGLINGRTLTTLVPDGTATRAEAATILQRFVEEIK